MIFISFSQTAFNQDYASVLEQKWIGGSNSRTDLTESGYFVCKETLYEISYDEYSNTFTGKSLASFDYNGSVYEYNCYIKGKVNTDDNSVVIDATSTISSDDLPDGLYWTHPTLNLVIYEDDDHSGEYVMIGQSSAQYYDDEYVAYGTYAYY